MKKIKCIILLVTLILLNVACSQEDDITSIFYGTRYATGLMKKGNAVNEENIDFYKKNGSGAHLTVVFSDSIIKVTGINSIYTGTWYTNKKGSFSCNLKLYSGEAETDSLAKQFIDYVSNAKYYEGDDMQLSLYKVKGKEYLLFRKNLSNE
jgi:hypothetical protein